MSLLVLIIGIVLFLIGAYLQHGDKNSIAAWLFMGIGGLLWVTAIMHEARTIKAATSSLLRDTCSAGG